MSILCAEFRVADVVFRYLERDYAYVMEQKSVEEQEEVCRLALLQYYSTQVELTGQRREYASQLLEEFNRKGMRFAFWNKFDRELLAPYQMEGRVFAEYVGNPGQHGDNLLPVEGVGRGISQRDDEKLL